MPALPLLITADPDLLDDIVRLAAAGGSQVHVASDPIAARPHFGRAPLVLVGIDQAEACVRAGLRHRRRLVVTGRADAVDGAWTVAERLGADHVAVLPSAETWLMERFSERLTEEPPARMIAVIGGRGGAGASTLAGGLAVTAVAARQRTLLVDADPLGGGLDLLLGWERIDGLRWTGLAGAGGRVDPPILLRALPRRGDLVLLSFARDGVTDLPVDAMAAALDAARRGRDVIVADLPRRLDDAATVALQTADRALVVVPAELRAAAAASRIASVVTLHCPRVDAIVRGPAPGKLKPHEVARAAGLPLAGTLRPEPAVCHAVERGEGPAGNGPLAALCRRLIAELIAPEPTEVSS